MPKFYVQSGRVRLVVEATSERLAAVKAFEWTCRQQAAIAHADPLRHAREAERRGWQLDDTVAVSQQGFDRWDSRQLDTRDVVDDWQRSVTPRLATA